MKPIEETHPSLKGKDGVDLCFLAETIQEHTLDKAVVRKVLGKLRTQLTSGIDDGLLSTELQSILKATDMEELTNLIGSSEQEILNIINKSNQEEGEAVQEVAQLGKHVITCPKCQHKFKKED